MDELVIDYPTLGHLADGWIYRHCVVPAGFKRGQPFEQSRWQYEATARYYQVRAEAVHDPERPLGAQAFVWRKVLVVGPQKSGKGPWSAAITTLEAVGPSQFVGWAEAGDRYVCADHGCPCGWVYEYAVGEPMGERHPSPLIQLTAIAEDQVANVYGPLTEMVASARLAPLLQVREEFVRILGKSLGDKADRIDVVTSKARTRLGQPITFALQDEYGLWTGGMQTVSDTQDRGAAGMNGRTLATTNAYDPSENSAAQALHESDDDDVLVIWDEPPADLDFRDPDDRRALIEYVYRFSPWVNVDTIVGLCNSLVKRDPGQAERFFCNRLVRGGGRYMPDLEPWTEKRAAVVVRKRTRIALGFDGSDSNDWTGIRCETLDLYQWTPTYLVGGDRRPTVWRPDEWNGQIPREEVRAAIAQIFRDYDVVRAYCDPFLWETDIDGWAAQYGEKRVVKWATNRIRQTHAALERFRDDVLEPQSPFRHDDCPTMRLHLTNAVKRARQGETYIIGKPEPHQKIDLVMSGVLAHEAANDARAAGASTTKRTGSTAMFGFS